MDVGDVGYNIAPMPGESMQHFEQFNWAVRMAMTDEIVTDDLRSQPRPQPKTTPPYREIAHPATANFRPPHGKGPQGPSKQGAHNGKI